jgi:hypothetical protein
MESKPINSDRIHTLTSDILDAAMILESVQTAEKIEFITAIAAILSICMKEQEIEVLHCNDLLVTFKDQELKSTQPH